MFSIMVVCSGNQCRSPLTAALLRRLTEGLPVEVASAGTLNMERRPAHPEMVRAGRVLSLDLSGHSSQRLKGLDVSELDLLIGHERNHVAYAVIEAGASAEVSFTLPELVRLLREVAPSVTDGSDPEARARELVRAAHEARIRNPRFVPGEDIKDPIGGPRDGYEAVGDQIRELCERLVASLFLRT